MARPRNTFRPFPFAAGIAVAILGAVLNGGAAAQERREATVGGAHVTVEGLMLQRVAGDAVPWVFDNGGTENVPGDDRRKSTSDEVNDGFEHGVRLTLGGDPSGTLRWAASGFWLNEYVDGTAVDCLGRCELFTVDVSVAFDGAELAAAKHRSQIWGVEGNLIYAPAGNSAPLPLSVLLFGGVRFVTMDDDFELEFEDATGVPAAGRYDMHTDNRLAGMQVGVTATLRLFEGVRTTLTGAAGPFANFIHHSQNIRDLVGSAGETSLRDVDRDSIDVAYLGEVRAALELDLARNLTLGLGGQFLYLNGVALAASQLDPSFGPGAGTTLDTGETTWFYGARSFIRWRY